MNNDEQSPRGPGRYQRKLIVNTKLCSNHTIQSLDSCLSCNGWGAGAVSYKNPRQKCDSRIVARPVASSTTAGATAAAASLIIYYRHVSPVYYNQVNRVPQGSYMKKCCAL